MGVREVIELVLRVRTLLFLLARATHAVLSQFAEPLPSSPCIVHRPGRHSISMSRPTTSTANVQRGMVHASTTQREARGTPHAWRQWTAAVNAPYFLHHSSSPSSPASSASLPARYRTSRSGYPFAKQGTRQHGGLGELERHPARGGCPSCIVLAGDFSRWTV